jgi:hypothetical protein
MSCRRVRRSRGSLCRSRRGRSLSYIRLVLLFCWRRGIRDAPTIMAGIKNQSIRLTTRRSSSGSMGVACWPTRVVARSFSRDAVVDSSSSSCGACWGGMGGDGFSVAIVEIGDVEYRNGKREREKRGWIKDIQAKFVVQLCESIIHTYTWLDAGCCARVD